MTSINSARICSLEFTQNNRSALAKQQQHNSRLPQRFSSAKIENQPNKMNSAKAAMVILALVALTVALAQATVQAGVRSAYYSYPYPAGPYYSGYYGPSYGPYYRGYSASVGVAPAYSAYQPYYGPGYYGPSYYPYGYRA